MLLIGAACLAGYGIWAWSRPSAPSGHRHIPGANGGIIIAVGHDHHHVEALFAEGGLLKLFTLGQDQTRVATVPVQTITAYVRAPETTEAVAVLLEPKPRPEDPPDQTSVFEGQLPLELVGSQIAVVVPSITIGKAALPVRFHDSRPPRGANASKSHQ